MQQKRFGCPGEQGSDLTSPGETPYAWQSIKAMTRRYAEGFDDGILCARASNLLTSLSVAVSRFLETPTSWDGDPTNDEKRDTIDHIKAAVSASLATLSGRRLREHHNRNGKPRMLTGDRKHA